MNPRHHSCPLLLAAFVVSCPAAADDEDAFELKPNLVVTPSRAAEPIDETLTSVSVITRDDISRSAAEDLVELLRLQPGVDIVRTGGPGAQTSIFLRGANSNHVLVLIDGVRVGSANTGAYAWEQLPLNQVERVEIVRGPRGSLYGSDSIGGVIQVFTRSDPAPYARVTAGSFGTAEFEGGWGHQGKGSQFSINAGFRDVDGFSAQNPYGFSYHPDNDGVRAANLGIKGSAGADYGRWDYSLLALDTESEFDQGHSDARQYIASIGFTGYLRPSWDYQLSGGYIEDSLFSDFEYFTTDFDSRRLQFSWQNHVALSSDGQVSFGLDYYRESGKSADSWNRNRDNSGVFASYDQRFGRVHAQLGGRFDDNSRFGGEATGQVALGFDITEAWKLTGSYGSAFRGPNLSEQYSPGVGGLFAGNPDLDPESSTSGEIALHFRHALAGHFSATYYRTDVDSLIAFNGPNYQAINIDRARLHGLELEYVLNRGGWLLKTNATLQDTEDLATGQPLLRRPDRKASATLDYRFSNGSWAGLEWVYAGEREDFGGITLDAYQIFSLRAGWNFLPDWRLELRGENLTDERYEPAYGFDGAGRSWFVSLGWFPRD